MRVWQVVAWMAMIGGLGGGLSYLTTTGLRRRVTLEEGPKESGIIATVIAGGAAAAIAWALVGTRGDLDLTSLIDSTEPPFTIKACLAALGVGLSGSKWLGTHYQAKVFAFAGEQAALVAPDQELASSIASRDPKRIKASLP